MSTEAVDLLPAAPVAAFLDRHGIGSGSLAVTRIGEGASNLTFRVERTGARVVVRRPPPPPLPPSAHDVVREATVIAGAGRAGLPVPRVLAVCSEPGPIGVPFFVMEEVEGVPVTDAVPPALDAPELREQIAFSALDALADVHRADIEVAGLCRLARPNGFLERQLRRWGELWTYNATRDLPEFAAVGAALAASRPESPAVTLVHGDYRLGNLLYGTEPPARLTAILDWELATLGDPLADLGYLLATWADADDQAHPMQLSPVTRAPGFPSRDALVERYARRTGTDVSRVAWYRAFSLWKAAVFCEAIYGRYRRGERSDALAASFGPGVPALVTAAAELLQSGA